MDDLLPRIRSLAGASGKVRELSEGDARRVQDGVAAAYASDPSALWWWERLTVRSSVIPYGEGDALEILRALLGGHDDTVVTLLVTDDEPPPWPAFAGPFATVRAVIAEQRFFEYCLVGPALTWVVFDTHHNTLIVAGELAEQAGELPGAFRRAN